MTKGQNQITKLEIPLEVIGDLDADFANAVLCVSIFDMTFRCTVNCGGVIVAGVMIGVKDYYHRFTAAQGFKGEALKELNATWSAVGEKMSQAIKNAHEENPLLLKRFVGSFYMKDAFFISGARLLPTNEGLLWKGKTSSVDGFAAVSLSPGKTDTA